MRKRILALALSFCMALGLMPQAALAADHVHDDTCGYSAPVACGHTHNDDCGYAEAVEGQPCAHESGTHNDACGGLAEGGTCNHTTHDGDCGYAQAVAGAECTHTCTEGGDCGYSAGSACTYSTQEGGTDPTTTYYTITYTDGVDGEEIFGDQIYTDVASGDETPVFEGTPTRTGFTFKGWSPELAATVTGDATYDALWEQDHTHSYMGISNTTHHWEECTCGDKQNEAEHTYSAATCSTPATCACGAATGSVDSTNHTGGTEVRGASSATATQSGYTGDTYCLGCDTILVTGSAIPATGGSSSYADDDNYTPPTTSTIRNDDNYTPPIPTDTEQNEDGDTVTTAEPISIVRNDKATTTITITDGNRLVNEVVRNDSDQLVIAPKIVGDVSSAEISIPSIVMEWVRERTNVDLRLVTPIADGTIDFDTLVRHMGELSMETRRTDDTIAATVTIGSETVIDAGVTLPGGVEMTDDMKLIVSTEKATLAPIASTMVEKASLGDLQCPEEYDTLTDKDTVEIYGIKCKLYETLVIAGLEYILLGSSQDGPVLLRLLDGRGMVYTGGDRLADNPDSSFDRTVEKPINTTVTIDGVTYDVAYIVNNSTYILYRDGQLAGMYPSTDDAADLHRSVQFYEGYDPETLKAQQDDNDLGSVTIPADYDNAAIADLAPGKTYKVSVVAANDISVEGYDDALLNSITEDTPEIAAAKAELERREADMGAKLMALTLMDINDPNYTDAEIAYHEASQAYASAYTSLADLTHLQGATVTQTFKIPDKLVGAKTVKYVGVHDTNPHAAQLAEAERVLNSYFVSGEFPDSDGYYQARTNYDKIKAHYDAWEKEHGSGAEYGTVTFSRDGLTLTATHTGVRGFSPFIVYAFVEADEPEYKVITTNTEPAGGEDDVPASPATGDDTPALPVDDKKTLVYLVKRGDTLWAIARKYGCTVSEIVALNGKLTADPGLILVGWELLIPQG